MAARWGRRGSAAPGVLVGLVLLVAGAAACGDDDEGPTSTGDQGSAEDDAGDLGSAIGAADSETTIPSTTTTEPPQDPPREPLELRMEPVTVPDAAGLANDACGVATTFDPANLVDRVTETAWRTPGDGTGQTLTFSLGAQFQLSQVGLVPGYAKTDPCDGTDRFTQNRRLTTVTWLFEDGTAVTQPLQDTPALQTVAVEAVSSTVTLRLDGVTADPIRDFTAISEVSVQGR